MKWFTSDTHFGHEALITKMGRKIPSIKEANELILDGINSYVQRQDTLYILGDFAWHKDYVNWRRRIQCRNVWLIWGNHDRRMAALQAFGKNKIRDTMQVKVCGHPTWLSHYAHAYWPKSHHGSFHLYGHCHGQREDTLDTIWPERRSMEVSPDVAHRIFGTWVPFREDWIYERLIARKGHDLLEFYRK